MWHARDRILRPYSRRVNDLRHRAVKAVAVVALLMVAMVMGFWLAVFGTLVAQPFFALVGVLLLVALWMIDDVEVDYRAQLTTLFMTFIGLEVTWPSYLAVDIPGLPWLTPPRVVLAMMMFMTLLQFSQSRRARGELVDVMSVAKVGLSFYAVFWLCAFATVGVSKTPGASFTFSLQFLLLWNMPFIVAAWVMMDETLFPRMIRLLIWAALFIFALTVLEYINRQPIWFPYIPSFLKIDGPMFQILMTEQVRIGDERYRARGNHAVHLYFVQYVLLLTPFIVHKVFNGTFRGRVWAFAFLLFTLLIVWMTNTRTGMLGFILVVAGMVALHALRRYLNPTSTADMVAPAVLMAAPAGLLVMAGLIAASPRLQSMTFGGAQHRSSDQGRDAQWDRAWAALSNNPFGYGGGNSAPLAGRMVGDRWIVDSFWMNILLDYGVLGAIGMLGFLLALIWMGVRLYLRNADDSANLAGPAAVALGGYVLTMYTISYAGNTPFMLCLAGGIIAAYYRVFVKEAKLPAPVARPTPFTLRPLGRPA